MALPGWELSVIGAPKVRDYLLSPCHRTGRFKAAFFATLGYSAQDWSRLAMDLRRHAQHGDLGPARQNPYGTKYEVRASIRGPSGKRAELIAVRTVLTGEHRPSIRYGLPRREKLKFELLQTVVLTRDLEAHGLRPGDLGAVVQVYEPDGLEVEFVCALGRTAAVVTLRQSDVRAVTDRDLLSVRPLDRSA